jgi:glutamate dehydrogenase
MMDDLPADRELSSVKVFTSADSSLALNIFSYMQELDLKNSGTAARSTIKGADHIFALAARVQAGEDDRDESDLLRGPHPSFEPDSLRAFMRNCAPELVANSGSRSFLIKKRLHDSVAGHEDVAIHAEPWQDADVDAAAFTSITMAVPNVMTQKMLRRAVGYLGALPVAVTSDCGSSVQGKAREKLDIYRLHVDTTRGSEGNERMALFRILVRRWTPAEHGPAADGRATPALAAEPWAPRLTAEVKVDPSEPTGRVSSHDGEMSGLGRDRWAIIQQDLRRLKWLNERTLQLAAAQTSLGLERAEVIDALCSMMHSTLSSPEGWAMTKTHMWQAATCCDALPLSAAAAQLFIERFDPAHPLEDGEFKRRLSSLRQRVAEDLEQEASVVVLTAMLDAVSAALRTNLFLRDRFALAIRMDPSVFRRRFADPTRSPFGVIFVHGDCFSGFHVRFRDISRGGLRIVTPHADEQLGVESARLFQEAYNLAFAQQLKVSEGVVGSAKVGCFDCRFACVSATTFELHAFFPTVVAFNVAPTPPPYLFTEQRHP